MDKQSDYPYLPLSDTIAPTDSSGVADIVRRAAEASTPVYPMGGATMLGYGMPSRQQGIGLSLSKLNRLVDHASRDLTITVEAGMTLARLQKTLAAARQRLPVDVARPELATIGGIVAVGTAGPRSYRHGSIRDYVLGMHAIDGRGSEFAAGGRVVKNAAGYNVCRLLTGSLGTLAVITQVTLMVRPMAESTAWIACDAADFGMVERFLADLVHTETLPLAVEWLVGPTWDAEPGLADVSAGVAGRLLVGYEGTKDEVQWMIDTMAARWKQRGVASMAIVDGSQSKSLAQRLTDASAAEGDSWPACLTIRASVLPSVVVKTVEQIVQLADDASIQAHAGHGTIVARLLVDPDRVATLVSDRLRPLIAQTGGTMVVLGSPADARLDRTAIWGLAPAGFSTMQAIKQEFDPQNILNPGRFIFE